VQKLRLIMAPQREVLARLAHGEFSPVRTAMLPYYRDLLDRMVRISDTAETYRESLNNVVQVLLSLQQYQINQVIKVLTVLATLSMPILVITSFYGMNVNHVPNMTWSWRGAYAWVFGATGGMTAVIYWIMRRKRWL
jgi:magnesium transporter